MEKEEKNKEGEREGRMKVRESRKGEASVVKKNEGKKGRRKEEKERIGQCSER